MKNKLRKIVVEETDCYYRITDYIQTEPFFGFILIKVFLAGHKATPLVIEFCSKLDLYTGFALKNGVNLPNSLTNDTECVNVHKPKYTQKFILLGKKKGWLGNNTIATQNGMGYLRELGYDVSTICADKSVL